MINWKIRLQNKTFVLTLLTTVLAFVYNILGMFDIVPKISESEVTTIITTLVNLLALLGILIDPTTKGLGDSDRVLNKKD